MSAKIRCRATKQFGICSISVVALYENGELPLKLSFFVIILHKKTTNCTSNWRVKVKRKYYDYQLIKTQKSRQGQLSWFLVVTISAAVRRLP